MLTMTDSLSTPLNGPERLAPFTPVLFNGSLLDQAQPMPFPSSGPYQPQWRIDARGSSDDKGGVVAISNAWEALKSQRHSTGL